MTPQGGLVVRFPLTPALSRGRGRIVGRWFDRLEDLDIWMVDGKSGRELLWRAPVRAHESCFPFLTLQPGNSFNAATIRLTFPASSAFDWRQMANPRTVLCITVYMKHFVLALFLLATPVLAQPAFSPEVQADGRVTFRLFAPKATEVRLNCEGVDSARMTNAGQGVWTFTTPPLEPDIYVYSFFADGLHLIDPANPFLKYNLLNTDSQVEVPGPKSLPWEINDVPRGELHRHFYRSAVAGCPSVIGFELVEMFAPFGQIYDLGTFEDLMQIREITGIKHSSLNRELEWQRLELRDRVRPGFKIYTGNDLAIDMVMYGSDYLLGLSAFAPEAFALRDRFWAESDPRFHALNDLLQYLGFFAFRAPVPAYKHTAAQFLKLRGRIKCDAPHPKAAHRPASDLEILRDISRRLDALMAP